MSQNQKARKNPDWINLLGIREWANCSPASAVTAGHVLFARSHHKHFGLRMFH